MCLPRSPVGGAALSVLRRCGRDWEVCPEDVLLTALLWKRSMGVAQQFSPVTQVLGVSTQNLGRPELLGQLASLELVHPHITWQVDFLVPMSSSAPPLRGLELRLSLPGFHHSVFSKGFSASVWTVNFLLSLLALLNDGCDSPRCFFWRVPAFLACSA